MAAPSGAFTRNTSLQFEACTSRPPSDGPTAAATAAEAPSIATPPIRLSAGSSPRSSPSDVGTSSAAPAACTMRIPTRVPADGAIAHSSDAAVKVKSPAMNTRRRPTRSASCPAGISSAANTML